jgi:hypothetical protein
VVFFGRNQVVDEIGRHHLVGQQLVGRRFFESFLLAFGRPLVAPRTVTPAAITSAPVFLAVALAFASASAPLTPTGALLPGRLGHGRRNLACRRLFGNV